MIFERAKRTALIRFAETSNVRIFALSQRHSESDGAGKAVRSLIKREFASAASRRGRFVRRESARGGCTSLLNRRKELHQAVLNSLSLKSRTTSVHRSQKPRTSDAVSTRRPCFSSVNLSGISHLLASHLRITNYRRARSLGLRRFHCASLSSSSSSSSRLFFFVLPSGVVRGVTDVPRPKANRYPPSNRKELTSRPCVSSH